MSFVVYETIEEARENWKEQPIAKSKMKIGSVFGKLKVLYRTDNDKNKHTFFVCSCECGNYTKIETGSLNNGHATSCGKCSNRGNELVSLLNQQLGVFYVLEKAGYLTKSKENYWKCRCYHNKIHYYKSSFLKTNPIYLS